jgi:hypothetical protein
MLSHSIGINSMVAQSVALLLDSEATFSSQYSAFDGRLIVIIWS